MAALCVLCPPNPDRPPRAAEVGQACPACAGRARNTLLEIRRLHAQYTDPPAVEVDQRIAPVRDPDDPARALRHPDGSLVLRWRDPPAQALPAGPTAAAADSPHVTGTAEARPPVPVERLDLDGDGAPHVTEPLAPLVLTWRDPDETKRVPVTVDSRIVWVGLWHRMIARHPDGRPVLVPLGDQTGELPPRLLLEQWVTEWRAQRGWLTKGDELHGHDVDTYTTWLLTRLDWALDHHPALGDFAGEMRALAGRLRTAAGEEPDRPERERFAAVVCRNDRCEARGALYRVPGEDWIECGACGLILTSPEYQQWVERLAAHERSRRRAS